MNQITDRLWLGAQKDVYDGCLPFFQKMGITAVLNVRGEDVYKPAGCDQSSLIPSIDYFYVPLVDNAAIEAMDFVVAMLWLGQQYKAGKTIFIHCFAGISRSASILAAFMTLQDLAPSVDTALRMINAKRPIGPSHDTWQSTVTLTEQAMKVRASKKETICLDPNLVK